jgi:N-formylglutamate deformylase
VSEALLQTVTRDGEFGAVLDGRWKGGYITDHYGKPSNGVYAVQLELARRAYMNEAREQVWEPQRAQRAQALIGRLLTKYVSS